MIKAIKNYFRYNPDNMYLGIGGLFLTTEILDISKYYPYWVLLLLLNLAAYTGKRKIVFVALIGFICFWISLYDLYSVILQEHIFNFEIIYLSFISILFLRDLYFLFKYKINVFKSYSSRFFVLCFILVLLFCGTLILLNPNIKIL